MRTKDDFLRLNPDEKDVFGIQKGLTIDLSKGFSKPILRHSSKIAIRLLKESLSDIKMQITYDTLADLYKGTETWIDFDMTTITFKNPVILLDHPYTAFRFYLNKGTSKIQVRG